MSDAQDRCNPPRVAVVGGGLAGLAAAAAAVEHGCRVDWFEQSAQLGGRAASFRDPHTGGLVDVCQHVALGCCTNLIDLCGRMGLADSFERCRKLHFLDPDGRQSDFEAVRWLPAPLHLLPGLLRQRHLSLRDRWQVARALGRLGCRSARWRSRRSIRCVASSPGAIRSGHRAVLVARDHQRAGRDTGAGIAGGRPASVDRGILAAPDAYCLLLPRWPLQEWIDQRMGAWLAGRGVAIHRGTRIERIEGDADAARGLLLADGTRQAFDCVIAAVSWRQVRGLLSDALWAAIPALQGVEHLTPAAITAVHLWFDRPLTALPHAVLVDRLSQWVFAEPGADHHYQAVISASHMLANRDEGHLLAEVRCDLEAVWPAARQARLLHYCVLSQPAAVFSMRPGLDRFRPGQQTAVKNLFLAGDWTATGWPATMEGAVRSGRLAVEALLHRLGRPHRLLTADLPRGFLARWLLK